MTNVQKYIKIFFQLAFIILITEHRQVIMGYLDILIQKIIIRLIFIIITKHNNE